MSFRSLLVVLAALLVALPATAQSLSASAADAAVAHVRTRALAQGLPSGDLAGLVVSDGHTDERTGTSYVYLRQQLDGLDVTGTQMVVAVAADGRVLHAAGEMVAGLADGAARGSRAATLDAAAAVRAAAAHAGIALGTLAPDADEAARLPYARAAFRADGLSSPATTREVYHRAADGALRRAWEVSLDDRRSAHWWLLTVDAATGAELARHDLTVHEDAGVPSAPRSAMRAAAPLAAPMPAHVAAPLAGLVASYRVFAAPVESPLYTTPAAPADGRVTLADPANAAASPFGWHDTNGAAGAEFTITRGNNTHTYIDRDDNEAPDAAYPEPDGGASLTFNFPLDFAQAPNLNTRPAAVNLFYWTNLIHDIFWQHGFTSAAGNFQANTYGAGGVGNDAVDAEVQSGADICNEPNPCYDNANFATPADGSRPRMQMYVGTSPTPDVDGDFDNGVIVHEYGHGISTRLVGGPANVSCLQNAEQMGEGWSDFFGLMLTMRPGDMRTTRRTMGNYLFGQTTTGPGIRPAPYSTDFALNNYTYQRTRSGMAVPHGIGFVWATILWEVTWDMIDAHGYNANLYDATGTAGNQMMLRLVTEGLKLTACSPGFVSGRDAILAADATLYPDPANPGRGLHYATLWGAFARRGLGASASQGSTSSNSDNTEAFDAPLPAAVAQVSPSSVSAMAAPGGTTVATLTIANTAAAGSQSLTYTLSTQSASASEAPATVASRDGLTVAPGPQAVEPRKGEENDEPGSAASLTGGPDAFGYTFADSAEPGGPVFAWTDISTTGTPVSLAAYGCTGGGAGDEGRAAVALPFAFPFYGSSFSTVYVYANGLLGFDGSATTTCTFTNAGIPATAAPNGLIAGYWEDLDLTSAGSIRTQTVGGNFVVQYTNVPRYNAPGSGVTFQVILTPNGTITVQYQGVPAVNNGATVGIENPAGSTGLQVAYNAAYAAAGKAVRFVPPVPWLSASPASGAVAPGAQATATLSFNTVGLTEGTYTATLRVSTNDPARPTVSVPVSLTVGGAGVVAGVHGWRLLAAPAPGVTVDDLAAINLVQGVPGYYPPPQAQPNLLTGYDGTVFSSAGTGHVLPPGRGFFWYFYNIALTPGGPSNSYPLPTTLATTRPPVTTDVPVALHASGTRFNMLGNPFGVSLDLSGMASWPGAGGVLGSNVAQVWDAAAGGYETTLTTPTVAPWQGFFAQTVAAGTLTIPASARTTGGVLQRTGEATPEALIAFELASADGSRRDRAAVLALGEGRDAGTDLGDATKLTPMDPTHVLVSFAGADALRAVESLPLEAASVPMAVASVGAGAELVLRWPTVAGLPAGWAAVLRDTETGTRVDLATADHYAFAVVPQAARTALAPGSALAVGGEARFVLDVGPAGVVAGEGDAPAVLALEPVRPNPSTGSATVGFALPDAGPARVTVVDLLGREVAVLAEGPHAAGRHQASLAPAGLAPGVYVVRLDAAGQRLAQRVVVVR